MRGAWLNAGRSRWEATDRPAARRAATGGGLIDYTFGFSGVIAPENPNVCDYAPWMPGIEYGIQDIGDETAWLGRYAGMPANADFRARRLVKIGATKQTAPFAVITTA